jgi:D-glutamate cyclase-like protein
MDKKIEKRVTDCIGDNLDRLITIDWRGQGQIHPLYDALRRHSDGPLCMRAAQRFVEKVTDGDVVVILTGFPVGPFDVFKAGKVAKEHAFSADMVAPETDGVVAAALIARAVDLGFKAKPVIFCEEECVEIAQACCRAAGLRVLTDFKKSLLMPHTVVVLPFTKDATQAREEARRILESLAPKAAISIERPGRNEKGAYHMANGRAITDFVAKLDEVFEGVKQRGGLTIGIGDLGNELGMGALKDATRNLIFYGTQCRCGCGGGIGNVSVADATIFGAVSENASYAFLACLAHLLSSPELLQSPEMETRVLEAACSRGAIDGPSGVSVPSIDYLDVKNHVHQIELMRDIINSPERFFKLQPFFFGELISG